MRRSWKPQPTDGDAYYGSHRRGNVLVFRKPPMMAKAPCQLRMVATDGYYLLGFAKRHNYIIDAKQYLNRRARFCAGLPPRTPTLYTMA
jgi:hypothetical protein